MAAQHRLSASNNGTHLQVQTGDDIYIDLTAHLPDEWQLADPVRWMFAQLSRSPLAFGHYGDQNQNGFIVTTTLHLVAGAPGTEFLELELVNPYSVGPRAKPVPLQTIRFDFTVK